MKSKSISMRTLSFYNGGKLLNILTNQIKGVPEDQIKGVI